MAAELPSRAQVVIVVIGFICYRIVTRGERGDAKEALATIAGADYG